MKKHKLFYIAGTILLLGQVFAPAVNAYSLSAIDVTHVAPSSFPTGNFQGDFTIDAQNQSVSAGQTANFSIYLKSTGAVTKLTNVNLKVQLPKQDYVSFDQSLTALKLGDAVPTYDANTGVLTWHFDTLDAGQVNKTVLRLSTVNGGFAAKTPITVSGELTADSTKGAIDAQTSGQTVINGSKSLSTTNKFKSIYDNDEGSTDYHTNPAIDDDILWNVTIGAPKKVDGSIFLKPGSKIKVTYTIDPMLEYVEMAHADSPKPTVDGNTLTWELTAPSIAEQIANEGSFFTSDLSMKIHVKNDIASVFKVATNTLSAEATFNDGETFSPKPIDGKITISQSNPDTLPPNVGGSGFTAPHYGPIDANGNALLKTNEFPDISVDDDATLGFAFLPTSLWAVSPVSDFISYSIHYKVDPNLNIKKFFTGDFAYRPNPNVGSSTTPLKNAAHYSISVRYDEDEDDAPVIWSNEKMDSIDPVTGEHVSYTDAHKNNWHMLMPDVPKNTWLTAEQLGIPKDKHVKEVLLHFHYEKGTVLEDWDGTQYSVSGDENGLSKYYENNVDGDSGQTHTDIPKGEFLNNAVPAGIFASKVLQFNMTPKKGYVGRVENSMYYNFRGGNIADPSKPSAGAWNGSEYTWLNTYKAWSKTSGPQGAEIIKPTEGVDRRLKTGVQFDQLATMPDGSKSLTEGANSITAAIQNTKESKNDVTGPLTSYVLLPKGVTFTGNVSGSNVAKKVSDNYKDTGQTLVKVTYNANYLTVDQTSNATFNVNVGASTSSDPEIMVYSFVPTEKYSVPDIQGTPTITDTQKDVDKDNMNGQGTDKPMFYSGRDYHFDKSSTLSVSSKISNSTNSDVQKVAGDIVDYELNLKNTSEDTLNNMILMDTLPSVGDLSITTNEERESQFNMALIGPITLPKSWSDKVNVVYSTSNNPKKAGVGVKGMLDENTVYPSSAQKLADADGAEEANWMNANDVKDWSSIKSFKLELKADSKWVSGADMKIKFNLKVPTDAQIGQKAFNSFAFAANDSQVIEPYRQGVEVKEKDPEKPTGPTDPANPEKPSNPTTSKPNISDKSNNNNGKAGKSTLPKTGDNIRNTTMLSIIGLLILGILGVFIYKRKKEK
ncbi:peptidoglycan-binding protein [Companilactobacillus sp. RD055328]|uniref:LPXTG cell wall anchor domain-containing protein n=1 Tax=Companilactobacillus sp. RD055328 TaxID=2916634 RepID=UPI001FC849A8|nr:LPXTG cell wall anchor domain-containing protein [Companilactobacillus sp. RD055328]GKQ42520.1 peptidoglycan-binding protein [Companilactobacillus sp. RD055328]